MISNVFTYKLINKTADQIENVSIKLLSHDGLVNLVGDSHLVVPKQQMSEGTLFIEIRRKDIKKSKEKIKLGVYSNDELIETTTTNFLGPKKF